MRTYYHVAIGRWGAVNQEQLLVRGVSRFDDPAALLAYSIYRDGDNAPVSAADEGRFRYNVALQRFEVSENTGVWTPLIGGGAPVAGSIYPCNLATTSALPAYTRVGDVITADAVGAMPNIDGKAPSMSDRILLTSDGSASDVDNWIYVITALGDAGNPWEMMRAHDANTSAEVFRGLEVRVIDGDTYKGATFAITNTGVITLNTTPITMERTAIATDQIIQNLEVHQVSHIRYNNKFYPLPLGGAEESTAIHIRVDPNPGPDGNHPWGIYLEVTANQNDGGNGGGVKALTMGEGDVFDTILMSPHGLGGAATSVGYEAATYADGTRGFIGTVQYDGLLPLSLPHSVHFIGLWGHEDLPLYGQIYLQESPGHAILIQKLDATYATDPPTHWQAQDGYPQIRLTSHDFTKQFFGVYNDGTTRIAGYDASAGSPIKDSPEFQMYASYWTGAAARDYTASLKSSVVDESPLRGCLRIAVGDYAAPTTVALWYDTKQLDMQDGSIVAVDYVTFKTTGTGLDLQDSPIIGASGLTMKATGGDIDLQNGNVSNVHTVTMVATGGNVDLQGGSVVSCSSVETAAAATTLDLKVNSNTSGEFHDTIADGETAFLVRVRKGAVYSLQRVSCGADDSGGVGYKVLRVPN